MFKIQLQYPLLFDMLINTFEKSQLLVSLFSLYIIDKTTLEKKFKFHNFDFP